MRLLCRNPHIGLVSILAFLSYPGLSFAQQETPPGEAVKAHEESTKPGRLKAERNIPKPAGDSVTLKLARRDIAFNPEKFRVKEAQDVKPRVKLDKGLKEARAVVSPRGKFRE